MYVSVVVVIVVVVIVVVIVVIVVSVVVVIVIIIKLVYATFQINSFALGRSVNSDDNSNTTFFAINIFGTPL